MLPIFHKVQIKALLEFRAFEDQLLQKHLMVGAKNAQYTSPDTQNEIISICKSLVLEKIVKDVEESGMFSIICDECTDIANHERLLLSLRYVARGKVCESFVGYFELDVGVIGEAIANTIEKAMADCQLDPY